MLFTQEIEATNGNDYVPIEDAQVEITNPPDWQSIYICRNYFNTVRKKNTLFTLHRKEEECNLNIN